MPRKMPHVPGVEHDHVQAGEVRLHVASAGPRDGDPVVLLHGWPQHWYLWRNQIPPLVTAGYRVIAPDLRGFGWSEAPRSSYAKEEFARDVVALLDALGLERVRLVGHDWGAFTGHVLCIDHPERVEAYVAIAVGPPWLRSQITLTTLPAILAYQPLMSMPVLGSLAQRHAILPGAFFRIAGGRRIWSEEDERIFTDVFKEPEHAEAASRTYRTFLLRELGPVIRGSYRRGPSTVRTLLLVPTRDPIAGVPRTGYADPLEVREVDGGHFLPEEKPEEVTAAILEFFAGP